MPDHQHDTKETNPDDGPSYEAPVVEDLETVDGPAVTAAGKTKAG